MCVPIWLTRTRFRQPGETFTVWKLVALPMAVITKPPRALSATLRARSQAVGSRRRRMEPSQAKLNMHPRPLRRW
jgi:hypothetical protein